MYIIAKDRKKVVLHSHPLTPSKSLILRTFKTSFFLMNTFIYLSANEISFESDFQTLRPSIDMSILLWVKG